MLGQFFTFYKKLVFSSQVDMIFWVRSGVQEKTALSTSKTGLFSGGNSNGKRVVANIENKIMTSSTYVQSILLGLGGSPS